MVVTPSGEISNMVFSACSPPCCCARFYLEFKLMLYDWFQLNADLMSITDLYSNFAEPYGLWDCQLAILHCAGHPDSMLIATVWDEIISRYVKTKQTRLSPPFEQILWKNTLGLKIYFCS